MKTTQYLTATAIAMAALTSTSVQAEVRRPPFSSSMDPMPTQATMQAERTIDISPQTQWVNVRRMEVVRFVSTTSSGTKTFIWRFDARTNKPFRLNEIAPAGFVDQPVTVYVAPSRNAR